MVQHKIRFANTKLNLSHLSAGWTELKDFARVLIYMQENYTPENLQFVETAFNVMKFFIPFLFALCFHEFAHGWMARRKGDRTAELMGRLTLNPLAHIDPIGTVVLPILAVVTHIPLFGWAKPVPVDARNFKNPKNDMFWVALAGPVSNLILALIGSLVMAAFLSHNYAMVASGDKAMFALFDVLRMFIVVNVFLAIFNLIPLHPLDGGKVIARFLPYSINRKLEDLQQYTSLFLIVLFVSGGFRFVSGPALWVSQTLLTFAERIALL
jgi:Zn-dependent protease